MKVAVVDIPTILKFLHKYYVNKNMVAQQVWQIIEDLSKKYDIVIIPTTAIDKLNDVTEETKRQIRKDVLSKYNIIVRHYSSHDIFVFAKNVSKEFKCPVDVIRYDLDDVDYNNNSNKQVKYTVTVF